MNKIDFPGLFVKKGREPHPKSDLIFQQHCGLHRSDDTNSKLFSSHASWYPENQDLVITPE